jgi:hypothetical protein
LLNCGFKIKNKYVNDKILKQFKFSNLEELNEKNNKNKKC